MLETILLIISVLLIALVLLQSNKASDAGQIINSANDRLFGVVKERGMELFITSTPPSIDTLKLVMYIAIIIYIIYNVIYYILNIKLLSKGVNVD